MSWAGKRKVRKILEALVAGDGEPKVANDLTALVAIRDTRSAIEKHDISPEASGIWLGLKSRAEVLTGALKLQAAAAAVKQGLAWTDEGLDALAAGRGGETLAGEVQKLRSIGELDRRINAFPNLRSQTGGLWRGLETDVHVLRVATKFARLLEIVRSRGAMEGELQLVATGACGETFARDHQLLAKRTACERQLSSFDQLGMSTHGVWKGLDTDVQGVEKAIRFQGSMAAAISNLALAPSEVPAVSAVLERLVVDGNGLLDVNGPVAGRGQDYLDAWAKLQPAVDKLAQQGHFSDHAQADFQEIDVESLVARCKNLVISEARLHAWCAWRKVRGEAITVGLSASGSHAFLLNLGETDYEEWVAIKSGFSSGYIGEGPRTLSETLALLGAFDVSVEEVTVDPYLLQRLDQSALTIKDLEFVTHAPPIRPRRVYDYMADGDFGYANQSRALRRLNTAMPWGSLDSRLYDLAKSFENNPDHALMAGFRRLEETVRNRVGKDVSEAKVFASAFLGEKPCLTWVDITTAERISRGNLFVGAYGAFRNPRAHKELNQDRVTQLCEFMTLNLLFRLEATAIEFVGAKDNEAC